jgi:integrase/recombinase XerC
VLDEAVADGSWKETPLGRDVERFLRHKATEWSPASIVDYRATLARLAVDHAHLELADFEGGRGAELLEDFLHRRYRQRSPGTRKKVRAQLRSFFAWATALDKLERNPAVRLTRPRRIEPTRRRAHSIERITAIIEAQPELRDRVAIALMARHGLRKNEVRLLRWRDLDLAAGLMRLHAKGGRRPELPIVFPDLLADLNRLYQDTRAKPSHYLLFPRRIGNLPTRGGRGVVAEHPERPMQPSTMHRWWKRCLEQAGAADFPLHELRHSAGTEFQRASHDLKLTQLFMRHASIQTTADYYLHPDADELVAGLEAVGERWRSKE